MTAATRPLVSIIIDNFNYATFLAAAIDSAQNQSYDHLEIIVVDDGSTDDSRDVLAAFPDSSVRKILKPNGGQASAVNAGFQASAGEIVVFLDADDFLLPGCVEAIVTNWEPGIARLSYRLVLVDAGGFELKWRIPTVSPVGMRELGNLMRRHGPLPGAPMSGNAFSRSVLKRLLPMPEPQWRISADGYLIQLSNLLGPVKFLKRALAAYRLHGSNRWSLRELDVSRIRHIAASETIQQRMIFDAAADLGKRLPPSFLRPTMGQLKHRISLLRLNHGHGQNESQAYFDGTVGRLARMGIWRALTDPFRPFHGRVLLAIWFLLMAVAPGRSVPRLCAVGLLPGARTLAWLKRIRLGPA